MLSLVQRGGKVRSLHVDDLTTKRVASIVTENVSREAHLRTDAAKHYTKVGREFASHETVEHGEYEYVRYEPDGVVHTNTIEGYFSIFKRGMKGVYQHCGKRHLHRYLAEFDFRYNQRVALGVGTLSVPTALFVVLSARGSRIDGLTKPPRK